MYNSDQIDELLAKENVEQPQTIIFNKITGALVAKMIGSHMDLVNTTYCKGKLLSYNPDTHEYVGDYDTGSVQSKSTSPRIIEEHSLDSTAGDSDFLPYVCGSSCISNASWHDFSCKRSGLLFIFTRAHIETTSSGST